MPTDGFTIDKLSWHVETKGNGEAHEHMLARFFSVAMFLQTHGLTNRILAVRVEDIDAAFEIRSTDLTEKGLSVMRAAYDKWLRKVDQGLDPRDTSILEKALRKL